MIFLSSWTCGMGSGRWPPWKERSPVTPEKLIQPYYDSAILNGLEIFKISDSDLSLAAVNKEPSGDQSALKAETNPVTKSRKSSPLIYAVIASIVAVIVVAAVVSFLIFRVKGTVYTSFPKSSWVPLSTRQISGYRKWAPLATVTPTFQLWVCDPEYYQRRQLTDKSDVFSFGVVLVEALCGRPAILQILTREQMNLAEWAKSCYKKGILDKIIDPNLRGGISSACLNKYIEKAMFCLRDKGIERPVMSDVLWSLEFALQRQEEAENDGGGSGGGHFFELSPSPLMKNGEANTTDEEETLSGGDRDVSGSKSTNLFTDSSERLKSGDVFFEIENPLGR